MTSYLLFLGAAITLTVAPGPDNIFVITTGISRGRQAAITTALGMVSGVSVHTLAAAAGISALFYSSALAFQGVKFAGAAYLLYLAYKALTERSSSVSAQDTGRLSSDWALYKRGFIMNVLNPKVALFFLAFLPQFTTPGRTPLGIQMVLLGLLFMLQAAAIFSVIGYFSGRLGELFLGRPKVARAFSYLSSGIFAALGFRLALATR